MISSIRNHLYTTQLNSHGFYPTVKFNTIYATTSFPYYHASLSAIHPSLSPIRNFHSYGLIETLLPSSSTLRNECRLYTRKSFNAIQHSSLITRPPLSTSSITSSQSTRSFFNFSLNSLSKNDKKTTIFVPERREKRVIPKRDKSDSLHVPLEALEDVLQYHHQLKAINEELENAKDQEVLQHSSPDPYQTIISNPDPILTSSILMQNQFKSTEKNSMNSNMTCITKLANGLTVASEDTHSQMSAMGLYIKAGTRYETDAEYGICALLERLAFRTTSRQTAAEVIGKLENMGAHVTTSSSRECLVYSAEVLRELVDPMLEMISDTILRPLYCQNELETQVQRLEMEMESNAQHPVFLIGEILHQIAFSGSYLSRSLLLSHDKLNQIKVEQLEEYVKNYYIGSRMVLSGASVDHQEFTQLADKYFGLNQIPSQSKIQLDPTSSKLSVLDRCQKIDVKNNSGILLKGIEETINFDTRYIGGMQLIEAKSITNTGSYMLNRNHSLSQDENAYLTIAFQCGGLDDPDFYITYTLNMLMGGGMSFSAGGPGKGMYTRLNTNVINRYGWVESCEAFISSYSDIGLFGVNGACSQRHLPTFLDVLCDQLIRLTNLSYLSEEEVMRARNQTKTSIFYNLETRSVLYDDIGRHVMAFGKRITPAELCKMIDTITPRDISRCAQKILSTPPTVVAYGPEKYLAKIPSYDHIKMYFEKHKN